MREAPRLDTTAVDGEVVVVQSLTDKTWKHHAVGAGLPRPNGVEEPDDGCVDAEAATVAVDQCLAVALGYRVGPPSLGGRANDEVIVLAQRAAGMLAVDLGGRAEQHPDA